MQKITRFWDNYRFLSNFFLCEIEHAAYLHRSVEHAYQAAKMTNYIDKTIVRSARTPSEAKRVAHKFKIREDWEQIKDDIMLELLRIKFNKEPLKVLLLSTGEAELIEGNTWGDVYWGVCNGIGQNKLGKLLMQVRKEIQTTSTTIIHRLQI